MIHLEQRCHAERPSAFYPRRSRLPTRVRPFGAGLPTSPNSAQVSRLLVRRRSPDLAETADRRSPDSRRSAQGPPDLAETADRRSPRFRSSSGSVTARLSPAPSASCTLSLLAGPTARSMPCVGWAKRPDRPWEEILWTNASGFSKNIATSRGGTFCSSARRVWPAWRSLRRGARGRAGPAAGRGHRQARIPYAGVPVRRRRTRQAAAVRADARNNAARPAWNATRGSWK